VRQILLDTDIGGDVDDALALGLVLACPDELELVAVTSVSCDARQRAAQAAGLLELADCEGVDVCAGADEPLLRLGRWGWTDHEKAMLAAGHVGQVSGEPAAERIVRAAREFDDLEIVMIGPVTNLARALALDPDLPKRVAGVTIMGGHIRQVKIGDFVCKPGIDYNLCTDPEASVAVLGAGFRTTLITADVTLQTWLRRADLERLDQGGPAARSIADQVRIWELRQRQIFTALGGQVAEDNVAYLHDPLTVWALVDDSSLTFEDLQIVTTLEKGVLRTLEAPAGMGARMRVATAVDAPTAEAAIVDRLLRL
jgi:purine nucleosidase